MAARHEGTPFAGCTDFCKISKDFPPPQGLRIYFSNPQPLFYCQKEYVGHMDADITKKSAKLLRN